MTRNLGDKDHVTVTYFFSRNVLGNSSRAATSRGPSISPPRIGTNINLSDVHTFSPTTANQAWLTFTRAAGGRVNLPVTGPATQTLAIVRLELSHPGTARAAQFLSIRGLSRDHDQRRSVHGF